jgi:hypothetical protein
MNAKYTQSIFSFKSNFNRLKYFQKTCFFINIHEITNHVLKLFHHEQRRLSLYMRLTQKLFDHHVIHNFTFSYEILVLGNTIVELACVMQAA